jgi:hypothetical protein
MPHASAVKGLGPSVSSVVKGATGIFKGGSAWGSEDGVPIMAAGGEYVLGPDFVRWVGGGNLAHGHQILDEWVKRTKDKHVKTLAKLPGPAK